MDLKKISSVDNIEDLPETDEKASPSELKVVSSIFGRKPSKKQDTKADADTEDNVVIEPTKQGQKSPVSLKCIFEYIMLGLLVLFSNFVPNNIIGHILPSVFSTNDISFYVLKAFFVAVSYYIIKKYILK